MALTETGIIQTDDAKTSYVLTGWLAPNGDWYACESWEHSDTAKLIIDALYPEEASEWDVYGVLYKHRFVHVTGECQCDMGYSEFLVRKPNCAQVDRLYDLYERASEYERKNIVKFIEGDTSSRW